MRTVNVQGIPFVKPGEHGDFVWMQKQVQWSKQTLFVYNENFWDSLLDEPSEGKGSAAIRPFIYKFNSEPWAAGIPTGWSVPSDGFTDLNRFTRLAIDHAVDHIKVILRDQPNITQVVFSCCKTDPSRIGSKIFNVADVVINYISDRLAALSQFDDSALKGHSEIEKLDMVLVPYAELHRSNALKSRQINALTERVRILENKLTSGKRTYDSAFVQPTIRGFVTQVTNSS